MTRTSKSAFRRYIEARSTLPPTTPLSESDPETLFLCDLRAALETIDKQADWKPIESAPRDGTGILVYKDVATVPVVHIAWFRSEAEWQESGQFCGGWETLEDWVGWWSYTRNSVTQEKLDGYAEPTHWMPLPEPPVTADPAPSASSPA